MIFLMLIPGGQTVDGGNGNDIFNINYSSSAKIKGGGW